MSGATTLRPAAPAPPTPAAVAEPARVRGRRRFWLAVGAALLAGLALRVGIGATDDAPSTDETAYLASGLSLVAGDGFARDGRPELHFPPLIPALLGAAGEVVPDPHTGTVVLTWLAGTALIVPLALLGRRIGGPPAGVATAWLAAVAPGLATTPAARGAGSEAEYTLLVVLSVWWAVAAADHRGAARLARTAAAGASLGLAYLARPEGLLLALPLATGVGVTAWRTRPRSPAALGAPLAAFLVPLALCVAPYAAYLHGNTGQWELTAKTQDVSIEAWAAVARGDREARDRVLYSPVGDTWRFPTGHRPLTALARDDPAGYARIVATNVTQLGVNVGAWWLVPVPVWLLAGRAGWRHRRRGPVRLLVAAGLAPVASSLAFFVQPRYLVVTVALAVVLAGVGLAEVGPRWRMPVAAATGAILLASSLGAFVGDGGWWHPVDHTDQRRAGEWVAAHTAPGDRVMMRSFVVEYYAHRPTVAMPYADLDGILAFARHYGARWLVVDQTSAGRLRPQVLPLLDGDAPPPAGLRLAYATTDEGRTTRVFALDPPPPRSGARPPGLGFMGDGS